VQRTYLFVPPEEKADVQALGAHWDNESKRWYIDVSHSETKFARWLPDADIAQNDDETFTIDSSEAYVAAATTACQNCNSNIQAICIYRESGTVLEEPLTQFTVSNVWAVDDELARQLRFWPDFRKSGRPGNEVFANHCPHCGSLQDDLYLHSETDQPFFDIPNAPLGSIRFTPLAGRIQLSGEEHFGLD
jgi:Domain of unknown function (DUF5710)